jgi:serine/threonine protein kinase
MLTRRLGSGKFSDVFEAVDVQLERKLSNDKPVTEINPSTLVVLKCLKPVAERKIKRELLVLSHASKLPNLARIMAVVVPTSYKNPNKKFQLKNMPSLVLEHAGVDSQWFSHNKDQHLSEGEIQHFLYHLLVALDNLHGIGIMHRDVKPRNVLIDRTNMSLMLIDLGLVSEIIFKYGLQR